MRTIQLRYLDRPSPVHRVRAEAKIIALAIVSTAIALDPGWTSLAVGWGVAITGFVVARLPRTVLAPPPRLFLLAMGFAALFSLLAGGDPVVAGVELGGLVDLAQLVTFGVLLVILAALIAWTTALEDVALGLGRLLRPLRWIGLPSEEITTTVVLAVRALPAVRAELATVMDARRTRPSAPTRRRRTGPVSEAVDVAATVVAGAYRRAHDLGRAMVARGSVTAPEPPPQRLRVGDVATVLMAAGIAAVVLAEL